MWKSFYLVYSFARFRFYIFWLRHQHPSLILHQSIYQFFHGLYPFGSLWCFFICIRLFQPGFFSYSCIGILEIWLSYSGWPLRLWLWTHCFFFTWSSLFWLCLVHTSLPRYFCLLALDSFFINLFFFSCFRTRSYLSNLLTEFLMQPIFNFFRV